MSEYDKSIHTNPDAAAWAEFYCKTHPEADLDDIRGWFANAMMAMHDHLMKGNPNNVSHWAQAILTALNVGDVKSGSPLHLKLREVMIAARAEMYPPYVVSPDIKPEDIAKMDFSRPGARLHFQPEMGANLEIVCKYTCSECGINRVEVRVPARPAEMDVVHWVQEVAARIIGADHAFRSPKCASRVMSEMLIPISGAPHIGFPSVS